MWQPKVTSKYKTSDYADDIDDGVFDYADFGNCIFRPDLSQDAEQNELIKFINDSDTAKLVKYLTIGKDVDDPTWKNITQLFRNIGSASAKRAPIEKIRF